MFELIDWLRENIPSEDSSGAAAGIVHGDFRIDNIVFHPTEVCCILALGEITVLRTEINRNI